VCLAIIDKHDTNRKKRNIFFTGLPFLKAIQAVAVALFITAHLAAERVTG